MHCKRTNHSKECDLVKHLLYGMGHCIVQRYWRRLWVYRKVVDEEASIFTNSLGGWLCCLSLQPPTTLGIGGYIIWCRSCASTTALNVLDSFLSAMAPAETLSKNIGRCRGITCTMLERFGQGKKVRLPTHFRAWWLRHIVCLYIVCMAIELMRIDERMAGNRSISMSLEHRKSHCWKQVVNNSIR